MIIGIDPGAKTGIATYRDGKLCDMHTTDTLGAISFIRLERPALVVIEDSTLDSYVFSASNMQKRAVALKVARNIGEVDGYCKLIKQVCGELGVGIYSIKPKDKGAKLDAARFKALTGWSEQSNQHDRDAAMVAWRFRSMKK